MTTTILTDEQIVGVWGSTAEPCVVKQGNEYLIHKFARAIEQAVLQSPEIQALRRDAERYRYLRDSAQLFSHFGDIGNSGWCVMRRDHTIRRVFTYNGPELDAAIDHARRVEEMNTKTPYQEGAEAKRSGATWFDCPYTDFYRRSQWFHGWDSARRVEGGGG